MEQFSFSYDHLPPSNNNYLKPTISRTAGKTYAYMYETKESKDFKKAFREALFREILKQDWDKSITSSDLGHWHLDLEFVQSNMGEDAHNYLKILLDSMTGYIYEDDKNIEPRINRVTYNKKNPRFSFTLTRTGYIGLFDTPEDRQELIDKSCVSCRFYRDGACSVLKKMTEGKEVDEYVKEDNACSKFVQKKK